MTFGNTGLMMALVCLSFSRLSNVFTHINDCFLLENFSGILLFISLFIILLSLCTPQLAEDLGAVPIWVFNNGILHISTIILTFISLGVIVDIVFYSCFHRDQP